MRTAEEIALEALNVAGASASDEWGEPLSLKVDLLPVKDFEPDSQLTPALKDWVLDNANRMPCPPDFIAAAAMVTLGSVIGARCVIKPKRFDDWGVVPNLWGVVVALPSAKKSPAISAAMKPLESLIAKAMEQYKADLATYENGKAVRDARKAALEGQLKQAAKFEI